MKATLNIGQEFELYHCDHCDSDFLIFAYFENADDDWEYNTGGSFICLIGGHCPRCGIKKERVGR